ncbi:hypothetical protein ENUP19_0247G0014 [Entamoeba nuttalli]|uniref:Uncharacterized protein n=2 Tax=Entamoeba nuttalli TaxID=412467 RepID=K2G4N8_ENTNP|nr:hypothetical protein ENU1_203780 [Entamoeba nuttalli P19]EKE37256.1 hypothetical protein ENU1_203780 [Entamoeba nuttalli P19]|eukprot:XP_008860414.1 hypothetical protein ENU1_203780 [Entamoeba nuttalli P19]
MLSLTTRTTNLLEQPLNTDLLNFLALDIQKEVIRLITLNVTQRIGEIGKFLITDDHCKWLMETIGKGFSLPLSEIDTISNCLSIYESWFLEEVGTPKPISDNLVGYCDVVVGQISLLFSQREEHIQPQTMVNYAELCLKAVNLLKQLSYKLNNTGTLRRIVCVLIASIDDMCGPIDNLTTTLPMTKVIDESISLLYQFWLQLLPSDNLIWGVFSLFHKKWIRISEVATNWCRYCCSIESSLLKWLFNPLSDGSIHIVFKLNDTTTETDCKEDYGLKFWLRILHCCGNPSSISDNKVFAIVQQGLNDMIMELIGFTSTTPLPNGNDMFNIFVDALYHPIRYMNHNNYSDGITIAIKSTILMFKKMSSITVYHTQHYCKILKIIETCLLSPALVVVEYTIQLLLGVFNEKNQPMALLLPAIVSATSKIISQSNHIFKLSAIRLIAELQLSIGKERSDVVIPTINKFQENENSITYGGIKKELFSIALSAFEKEITKGENLLENIKVIGKFIIDAANESSIEEVINKTISFFIKSNEQLKILLNTSSMDVIDFIEIIIEYSSLIENQANDLIPLFEFLLTFIESNTSGTSWKNLHQLVGTFAKLYCICFEVIPSSMFSRCNIMFSRWCQSIPPNRTEDGNTIFDVRLLNCFQQYVLPFVPLKTTIDELQMKQIFTNKGINHFDEYIHLYYKNDSILSFIELPWMRTSETKSLLLICRNYYGKQCYLLNMLLETKEWTLLLDNSTPSPYEPIIPSIEQASWNKTCSENIEPLLTELKKDVESRKDNDSRLTIPSTITEKSLNNQNILSQSGLCRILLKTLGITSFENKYQTLLPTDEVFAITKKIDSVSTKNNVYVDIINSNNYSHEFITFINGLGNVFEKQTGEQELKYIDDQYIIYFGNDVLSKSSYPNTSQIQIRWNTPLDTESTNLQISITPTNSDLYVIESTIPLFTLEKKQLINFSCLSNIVREAILSHSRRTTKLLTPLLMRKESFDELLNLKTDTLPFLDCLFDKNQIIAIKDLGFNSIDKFSNIIPFDKTHSSQHSVKTLSTTIQLAQLPPTSTPIKTIEPSLSKSSIDIENEPSTPIKTHKGLFSRKSTLSFSDKKESDKEKKDSNTRQTVSGKPTDGTPKEVDKKSRFSLFKKTKK